MLHPVCEIDLFTNWWSEIVTKDFNDRGQVDLVDYQTFLDGEFKYIMHFQNHCSKFSILRALTSKKAHEVAKHLFQIFIDQFEIRKFCNQWANWTIYQCLQLMLIWT